MRGRQPGKPTKLVSASVDQWIEVDRVGFRFHVWQKWKRTRRRIGTLLVGSGGLRWRPANGKNLRRRTWEDVAVFLGG